MRVLFVIAMSGTEARALSPVILDLKRRGARVDVLLAKHADLRKRDVVEILTKTGIKYVVAGDSTSLNAKRLLDAYAPDVVVLANDVLILNRFLIAQCEARRIPTVLLQEAPSAGQYVPVMRFKRPTSWIFKNVGTIAYLARVYAVNNAWGELLRAFWCTLSRNPIPHRGYGFAPVSVFCVFNETDAERYKRGGSRAKAIVATGIPGLFGSEVSEAPASDVDVCIFTTAESMSFTDEKTQVEMYQGVLTAIRSAIPGARVAVKYHPIEKNLELRKLLDAECLVISKLDEALGRSRIAVGTVTTVLWQALGSGRGTVVYQPSNVAWPPTAIHMVARDLGVLATNICELERIIAEQNAAKAEGANPLREALLRRESASLGIISDIICRLSAADEYASRAGGSIGSNAGT